MQVLEDIGITDILIDERWINTYFMHHIKDLFKCFEM